MGLGGAAAGARGGPIPGPTPIPIAGATPAFESPISHLPTTVEIGNRFARIRAEAITQIAPTEQEAYLASLDALAYMYYGWGKNPDVTIGVVTELNKIQHEIRGVALKNEARRNQNLSSADMEVRLQAQVTSGIINQDEADFIKNEHKLRMENRAKEIIDLFREGKVDRATAVRMAGGNDEIQRQVENYTDAEGRAEFVISGGALLNAADMQARLARMPEFAGLPVGVQNNINAIIEARFGRTAQAAYAEFDKQKVAELNAVRRENEIKVFKAEIKRIWSVTKKLGTAAGVVVLLSVGGGLLGSAIMSAGVAEGATLAQFIVGGTGLGIGGAIGGSIGLLTQIPRGLRAAEDWQKYAKEIALARQSIAKADLDIAKLGAADPLRRLQMAEQFANLAAGLYADAHDMNDPEKKKFVVDKFKARVGAVGGMQEFLKQLGNHLDITVVNPAA